MVQRRAREQRGRDGMVGWRRSLPSGAVATLLIGLAGCAFCPPGAEPTQQDVAAGRACHFTDAQQALYEQRVRSWHPPSVSW